ncbi:MAG: class I SAM-dependent methyltransferase [Epsilonproteobacteria bacterium]|nr:class I SAM-dependent methyltransferase [Campylobacterota bacterium]
MKKISLLSLSLLTFLTMQAAEHLLSQNQKLNSVDPIVQTWLQTVENKNVLVVGNENNLLSIQALRSEKPASSVALLIKPTDKIDILYSMERNLQIHKNDFSRLLLEENSFDSMIIVDEITELTHEQTRTFLDCMLKVLRPSGTITIIVSQEIFYSNLKDTLKKAQFKMEQKVNRYRAEYKTNNSGISCLRYAITASKPDLTQ